MKSAAIFPGLGSDYPDMLSCIRESPITDEDFGRINDVAGRDIPKAAGHLNVGKEAFASVNALADYVIRITK